MSSSSKEDAVKTGAGCLGVIGVIALAIGIGFIFNAGFGWIALGDVRPACIGSDAMKRIFHFFKRIADSRKPDFIIGGSDSPYMLRWWIIPRNRYFNIYLHHFMRSDDDRALHDHPWFNMSILLDGKYTEHTISAGGVHHKKEYASGAIKLRGARYAHRVELTDGPCWSLFITGPIVRGWGFHCPNGWRPWKEFVDDRDTGKIGRGCE